MSNAEPGPQLPDQAQLDAILAELGEPEAFARAEALVAALAPQLQRVLDAALAAGGWFDEAHEGAVLKAATAPDNDQRIAAVRSLVTEQTRLGMLVGVAVGMEIADRLGSRDAE